MLKERYLQLLIDTSKNIVILSCDNQGIPKGMVGMSLQPLGFTNHLVSTEIAWWVEPEHRSSRMALDMFKAAEDWSLRVGADFIQFVSLSTSEGSVDKFYTRMGYTMTEKAFLKEI